MIPDCDPERVAAVGNAAGSGAVRALLSRSDRAEIAELAPTITKVETAIEPRFQEHFVQAMAIPHATDPYRRTAAAVAMPPPAGAARSARRRRAPAALGARER
jgi:uncharacterized 2Fe-2S/4Fe-4S cluster protein (DUF4445 family)